MPPLVAHALVRLGAVQHPLVGCLRVDGPGADRADVAARAGLRGAERAELDVARAAEHLRQPLADLLGGALPAHRHGRQAAPGQREADACVSPEDLLERDRRAEAGRLEPLPAEEVERVEPDLRCLLEDRPGRLLALVPLLGSGAHDVAGELVHPVAHLPDVVGQVECEPAGRLIGIAHLRHSSPPRRRGPRGSAPARAGPFAVRPRFLRGTPKLLKSSMAWPNAHRRHRALRLPAGAGRGPDDLAQAVRLPRGRGSRRSAVRAARCGSCHHSNIE